MTNDRDQEFTADSILIDNPYYILNNEADNSYIGTRPNLERRNLDQYWIFFPREAASKSVERGMAKMKGLYDQSFNLTTSYRRDSDIPRPFGTAEKALLSARYNLVTDEETGELHFVEVMSPDDHIKQIMAAKQAKSYATWLVSNCDKTRGAEKRFQYAQQLIEAGLQLDGFGTCFEKRIDNPWSSIEIDENGRGVFQPGKLAAYKFYLAFENSLHCRDYVSEKFWRNSLTNGLVPVVYGPHPDDVRAMAPPNSFIHAEDFSSPAELVRYLEYLATNDTAYLEYHEWRQAEPKTLDTYVPPMVDGKFQKIDLKINCNFFTS